MSDVLTLDRQPEGAEPCANCGAQLHGPFCAACGQPVKPLDPPARRVLGEWAQEFFDVDSRVLRSLRRLLFSPGFLTSEHFAGRRVQWVSPLKLYLLTSVAAFAAMAFTGSDGGLRIALGPSKGEPAAAWAQSLGYGSAQEVGEALAAARETWIPRVMFVLVPFHAWLVSRVRRRAGRHYPAHLVFSLHIFAAGFAARAIVTVLGLTLPTAASSWLDASVPLYAVCYFYLALRNVYGGSRLRAVRDVILVDIAFLVALMLVSFVVVLTAVMRTAWLRMLGL